MAGMHPDLPRPTARFTRLNGVPLSFALGTYSCDILNWGFMEPVYWRNYLHTHSCFEVCYAFSGAGTFRISEVEHEVRAGDVFVARPGEPHEIMSSAEQPLGICFWAYTLLRSHGSDTKDVDRLLAAFACPGSWVSTDSTGVGIDTVMLEREAYLYDAGSREAILALTSKLMLDTARLFVPFQAPNGEMSPPRLTPPQQTAERIARYLRDNLGRSVTIRDVAAEVNLSERHTNRLFRAQKGISIVEHLTELRVEAASRLLLERRLSVKEVARAVGYSDVHYFTTLFHQRAGMPPAAFRARSGTRHLRDPSDM